MDQLFEQLAALLSTRELPFARERGGEARGLVAQQKGLYEALGGIFRDVPFAGLSGAGTVAISPSIAEFFSRCVALTQQSKATEEGSSFVVRGGLPILNDAGVERLRKFIKSMAGRSPGEAEAFQYAVAAAVIMESAWSVAKAIDWRQLSEMSEGRLHLHLASYAAYKAASRQAPTIQKHYEAELAALTGSLENYRSEFNKDRVEHRGALDALNAAALDIDDKTEKVAEALEQARTDLGNFESTIREELRLDRARLTWSARYYEARNGFRIACGLLALFLLTTIGGAVCFGGAIVAEVNRFDLMLFLSGGSVGTAIAHQLARLLVFSVPIVVYLWTLRAVMRYFMRSMLLMDDARQRETMLDTYFLLSEKGRADERDRPLILWALFRQTPGHGPDGIEPPDFTEVINAGMKRAESGTTG